VIGHSGPSASHYLGGRKDYNFQPGEKFHSAN
jgi:hypothetical protein